MKQNLNDPNTYRRDPNGFANEEYWRLMGLYFTHPLRFLANSAIGTIIICMLIEVLLTWFFGVDDGEGMYYILTLILMVVPFEIVYAILYLISVVSGIVATLLSYHVLVMIVLMFVCKLGKVGKLDPIDGGGAFPPFDESYDISSATEDKEEKP